MNSFPTKAALAAAFTTCQILAAFVASATPVAAQVSVMVAIDPSAPGRGVNMVSNELNVSLGKALNQAVRVDRSTHFADVLRATRTGEYDVYIVPGQVAASAMAHGYTLLANNAQQETFVLVVTPGINAPAKLSGKKMYLPQQDSIYAYMAKGMLNESGFSLQNLASVQYQKTSGAGLVAVDMGMSDATVIRKAEYDSWAGNKSGKTSVLLESKPIPAGLSLLVKKTLPQPVQDQLAQWAASAAPQATGVGRLLPASDLSGYTYVAGLGNFTPAQLPGVQRVSASQAAALVGKGAQLVDVRSEKEFLAKRISGSVLIPYLEKSPKDITFDAKLDDFSALEKLNKTKPAIFSCNGAECWKSYKAAKQAAAKGFTTVYWLRGGLPEWDEQGLPVQKNQASAH